MSTNQTLDTLRQQVQTLCCTKQEIHVDLAVPHLKLCCNDAQATLLGAYRHVFTIEERLTGRPVTHTFQYADLLTGRITIRELPIR